MNTENERLAVVETQVKEIKNDIKDIYIEVEKINTLNTSIALLTVSVTDLKGSVVSLNNKLDTVASEPNKEKANKWNLIINTGIAGLVGGLIGYFLMKLGLK